MKSVEAVSEGFPVYGGEGERLRADALRRLIRTMMYMIAAAYGLAVLLYANKLSSALVITAFLAVNVLSLVLLRRGYVRTACLVLVSGIWLVFTVLVFLGGGIDGIPIVFYLSLTVVAGLLLGPQAAVTTAGFSITTALAMVVWDVLGFMPPRHLQVLPLENFTHLAFAVILAVSALNLALRGRTDAVKAVGRRMTEGITALRESEALYRTALEASNDGVVVVANGRCLYCNQTFLDILRTGREALQGKSFDAFVHPEDRERALRYSRLKDEGRQVPQNYALRIVRGDGAVRLVDVSVADVVYRGGKAVLACLRDMTEKRPAEAVPEAPAENGETSRPLKGPARDAVSQAEGGRFIDVNRQALATFGV